MLSSNNNDNLNNTQGNDNNIHDRDNDNNKNNLNDNNDNKQKTNFKYTTRRIHLLHNSSRCYTGGPNCDITPATGKPCPNQSIGGLINSLASSPRRYPRKNSRRSSIA